MSIKVGINQEQAALAKQQGGVSSGKGAGYYRIDKSKERHWIRLVAGPRLWKGVTLQVIDGTGRKSYRFFRINLEEYPDTIFGKIDRADIQLQEKAGIDYKKMKRQFRGAKTVGWLGFVRDPTQDVALEIRPIQMSHGTHRKIDALMEEVSMKDPNIMLHGPVTLYDLIISKVDTPNQLIKYHFDPVPYMNRFAEQIKFSDYKTNTISVETLKQAFTPDELRVIDSCDLDIEEVWKYHSDEDVLKLMEGNKINLSSTWKNGTNVFGDPRGLIPILEKMGLSWWHETISGPATPDIPMDSMEDLGKPNTSKKTTEGVDKEAEQMMEENTDSEDEENW